MDRKKANDCARARVINALTHEVQMIVQGTTADLGETHLLFGDGSAAFHRYAAQTVTDRILINSFLKPYLHGPL